jgi:hypothetical protein
MGRPESSKVKNDNASSEMALRHNHKRRYREFVGGGVRDQAGLTAVAQETAD